MNPVPVLLFDWDGTLINSLPIKIANAVSIFEQEFQIPKSIVEAAYQHYSGAPRRELFNAILGEYAISNLTDEQYDRMTRRFSERNIEAILQSDRDQVVLPDTFPALDLLMNERCRMYISSSAVVDEIQPLAISLGLSEYFCEILGSSPGFSKGQGHVEYVLMHEDICREKILFTGDDLIDIHLGRQAGVVTVGRTGTHSHQKLSEVNPHYIIDNLSELSGIVKEIYENHHC